MVRFKKGHKNSKGEIAEWVIVSHKTGKIISSHKSKTAAQKHLKDIQKFKHIKEAKDLKESYQISLPFSPPEYDNGRSGRAPSMSYSQAFGFDKDHNEEIEYIIVGSSGGMSDESGEMLWQNYVEKRVTYYLSKTDHSWVNEYAQPPVKMTLYVNKQGLAYRSWKGKLKGNPVCNFHTGEVFKYVRKKPDNVEESLKILEDNGYICINENQVNRDDKDIDEDFSMGVGAPLGADQGIPHSIQGCAVPMMRLGDRAPYGRIQKCGPRPRCRQNLPVLAYFGGKKYRLVKRKKRKKRG